MRSNGRRFLRRISCGRGLWHWGSRRAGRQRRRSAGPCLRRRCWGGTRQRRRNGLCGLWRCRHSSRRGGGRCCSRRRLLIAEKQEIVGECSLRRRRSRWRWRGWHRGRSIGHLKAHIEHRLRQRGAGRHLLRHLEPNVEHRLGDGGTIGHLPWPLGYLKAHIKHRLRDGRCFRFQRGWLVLLVEDRRAVCLWIRGGLQRIEVKDAVCVQLYLLSRCCFAGFDLIEEGVGSIWLGGRRRVLRHHLGGALRRGLLVEKSRERCKRG